jgi:hypothetical protein
MSIVERLKAASTMNNKNYLRTGSYILELIDSQEKVGGPQSKIAGMDYTPAQVRVVEVLGETEESNPTGDICTMYYCRRPGAGSHFYDGEMLEFYAGFAGFSSADAFKASPDMAEFVTALAGPESADNCAVLKPRAKVTAYNVTTKRGSVITKYRFSPVDDEETPF